MLASHQSAGSSQPLFSWSAFLLVCVREQNMALMLVPCHPCAKPVWSSGLQALDQPISGYGFHLGSETDKILSSLSLSLILSLCKSAFQKKIFFQKKEKELCVDFENFLFPNKLIVYFCFAQSL